VRKTERPLRQPQVFGDGLRPTKERHRRPSAKLAHDWRWSPLTPRHILPCQGKIHLNVPTVNEPPRGSLPQTPNGSIISEVGLVQHGLCGGLAPHESLSLWV
jgi:hypothetical protein